MHRTLAVALFLLPNAALAQATRDNPLNLGTPSASSASSSQYWDYLMTKSQYTLSYHRDRGTPNWVAWHLSSAWIGNVARYSGDFKKDTTLPAGWYQVSHASYTNSGFDRGHNCPSADRDASTTDNVSTFYMTNIMPQAPANNQKGWAQLENYCRTLAGQGNELYIVSGNRGAGGTGSNGAASYLDANRVTVPNKTWKVIIILPNGSSDVGRVATSTRRIAVVRNNDQSITTSWGGYRTSIDAVESLTGYNFFSGVADSVENTIEATVDSGPTS